MSLPPVTPFPPLALRIQIAPSEWDAFLNSWSSLIQAYLSLPPDLFNQAVQDRRTNILSFLVSIFQDAGQGATSAPSKPLEVHLRRLSFMLIKRIILENSEASKTFCDADFLGNFCLSFNGSVALRGLVDKLWSEQSLSSQTKMIKHKVDCTQALNSVSQENATGLESTLSKLLATIKASPSYATFLMQGSDFFDAVVAAWNRSLGELRAKLTIIMYSALIGLLGEKGTGGSLLLDHLFTLSASQRDKEGSILGHLVLNTPLLRTLQNEDFVLRAPRSQKLLQSLQSVRSAGGAQAKRSIRRKVNRGKSKQTFQDEIHVHKLSLVSEIQDLFPNVGVPKVTELLDKFSDNTEEVVAYLIEHPGLASQTEVERVHSSPTPAGDGGLGAPSSARRNIFDGDDFDNLQVAASNLHVGHKETVLEPSSVRNKAAILSALAAFDSDSDERDDTYDADDVGGMVDTTTEAESDLSGNEGALYMAWKSSREIFVRSADARRGRARTALRNETGLTDEAIEGWATMLERNPRQLAKLEAKYAAYKGQQVALASTAWKANAGESSGAEGETEEGLSGNEGRRGGFGGRGTGGARGRGRGRGGDRGGNVAGSAGDRGTQLARQQKDANKSSRANHNRRNQRARKIARAGFPAAG